MQEIWKDIVGYEGFYQVSNSGNIKSLKRRVACKGLKEKTLKEKLLKAYPDRYGYLQVALCRKGQVKSQKVHRLVLKAFNPNKQPSINHIDGNKLNNNIENLEWCSVSRNAIHAYDIGLYKCGENHYKAKLSSQDVSFIKQKKTTITELARQFSVSPCTIEDILKGRTWKRHISNFKEKGYLSGTSLPSL